VNRFVRKANRAIVVNDSQSVKILGGYTPKQTYAWRTGFVHKFASLWVTTLRFVILNSPSFTMLSDDISTYKDDKFIPIDSFEYLGNKGIKLDFFVEVLGENRDAFRWSRISDFPNGVHSVAFTSSPLICITCIREGYHTPLFSLKWFKKCPLHQEPLIDACPLCGKNLSGSIRLKKRFAASLCDCENPWMSVETARQPASDQQRDEHLGEIIAWIEAAAEKCWTYSPVARFSNNSSVTYRQLALGLAEYGEEMPKWTDLNPEERQFETPANFVGPPSLLVRCFDFEPIVYDRVKIVFESGFKINSLARLSVKPSWREVDYEDVWKYEISSLQIFKSMRRYAFNHLLSKKINLLRWVVKNESAELLRVAVENDRFVAIAWAIINWMRSSIWRTSGVEQWIKGLLGHMRRDPRFPPRINSYDRRFHSRTQGAQRLIICGAKEQAEVWIEQRVNAAALLDLWPTQEELSWGFSAQGFIDGTRGRRPRPQLEWWAWRGDESRLTLAIMQRRPGFWQREARQEPHKKIRVARHATHENSKQLALHAQMIAPAICYGVDGSWTYDGDLKRFAHGLVKRARLLMGGGRVHIFGVAELPRDCSQGAKRWMLRCFDLPVLVFANDTRVGVARLKEAARLYDKSFARSPIATT
jgi:hypothetical protein